MLSKYVLSGILMDSFVLQYHIKFTSPEDTRDGGMCCIFSEKQTCIARRQPSELFENVFLQVVLSLLTSVKPF